MSENFVPAVLPPDAPAEQTYWFVFNGSRLLVHAGGERARLPYADDVLALRQTAGQRHYLGFLNGKTQIHCYTLEVAAGSEAPDGMAFEGLRRLYGRLDDELLWLAGRAIQIVEWDRTHQFCGRCGHGTETLVRERAKRCPRCGLVSYPRLAPAIIVRVDRFSNRVPEVLLARSYRYPPNMYSVLAGFVEPGETLEECVRREIKEEVGIAVKNIRYFGSQPWPFPNSLMIAFTAEHAGGDIIVQEEELEDACWFRADELPDVPSPMSISRRLIDDFVARYSNVEAEGTKI